MSCSWALARELGQIAKRRDYAHRCERHALAYQRRILDNASRQWGAALLADQIAGQTGRRDWADAFQRGRLCATDLLGLTVDDVVALGVDDPAACHAAVGVIRDAYVRPHAHNVWRRNPDRPAEWCWLAAERKLKAATARVLP